MYLKILNIKETKIITTEDIYYFNLDNEDIEIVKDVACLCSVINLSGNYIKWKLRLGRMSNRKIRKDHQEQGYPHAHIPNYYVWMQK